MTNQEIWNMVLGEMELALSRANFTTWFKNTSIISRNEDCVVVSVPNGFVKEWLENKFNKQIITSIRKLLPEIRDVRYTMGTVASLPPEKKDIIQFIPDRIMEEIRSNAEVNSITNLNKRYTFDSFVVGSNNELAHAACLAVAKNLGKVYNPLFLYGGVGLGKTHLLQATGNKVVEDNGIRKVAFISSERLTTEIIESVKNHNVEEMKSKYRKLDVLIIDDIQMIAGREKTQDIIFDTFNELYSKNKQIIFSSDRPPRAIPALEERLRSRFEGGMIADISAPDYETRLAILKLKAKENLVVIKKIRQVYGSPQAVVGAYVYDDETTLKAIETINKKKKPEQAKQAAQQPKEGGK